MYYPLPPSHPIVVIITAHLIATVPQLLWWESQMGFEFWVPLTVRESIYSSMGVRICFSIDTKRPKGIWVGSTSQLPLAQMGQVKRGGHAPDVAFCAIKMMVGMVDLQQNVASTSVVAAKLYSFPCSVTILVALRGPTKW